MRSERSLLVSALYDILTINAILVEKKESKKGIREKRR